MLVKHWYESKQRKQKGKTARIRQLKKSYRALSTRLKHNAR